MTIQYHKHMHTFRFLGTLCAAVLLLLPTAPAAAQLSVDSLAGTELMGIVLNITPQMPSPGELVTATASASAFDFSQSAVSWFVNGELIGQGRGLGSVTLRVGELGSAATVSVTAVSPSGSLFSKQLVLRPTAIDMVWETETYTPPLYKGKALPVSGALVRIIAFPNFVTSSGAVLDPTTLKYTWMRGGQILGPDSGIGKNVLQIKSPMLFRQDAYYVTVESPDGAYQGRGTIHVQSKSPLVLFYESNPVLGMLYHKAIIDHFSLQNEEVVVTAHPYFFSGDSRVSPSFSYKWLMNGAPIENPSADASSVTFRQTGEGSGTASVSLQVQNPKEVLQIGQGSFVIQFGQATNSNVSF
jgi:hypothetical protein